MLGRAHNCTLCALALYLIYMRYLGIDYGKKRTGIALSDEGGVFAFPHGIFNTDALLMQNIQNICSEESVGTIVMGESRTYQGQKNPIMKKIEMFKKKLETETGIPVVFEPEMLTSQEARRMKEEGDKTFVDDSAAALILQSFLDKKNNNGII